MESDTPSRVIEGVIRNKSDQLTRGQRQTLEVVSTCCRVYEFRHPGTDNLPTQARKKLIKLMIGQKLEDPTIADLLKHSSRSVRFPR